MDIFFSQNIKYLRNLKGISQEELGKVLDLKKSSITQYEAGRNYPNFERLLKLGEYFDVNIHEFIYTDLSQNPSNNVSNDASVMQRLAELEARQSEMDALFDRLFSPKDFDKLLSLFTEEFQMSLPELKEFFNQEVERRLKEEG